MNSIKSTHRLIWLNEGTICQAIQCGRDVALMGGGRGMYGVDGFEVLDVFTFGQDELVDELHALTILASFLVQRCQQIVFAHASRLGRGSSGSRRPERHGRRRSRGRTRRTRHLIVVLDRPEVGILSIKPPRRLSPHLLFVLLSISLWVCLVSFLPSPQASLSFFLDDVVGDQSTQVCYLYVMSRVPGEQGMTGNTQQTAPGGCGGLWPRGCTSRVLVSLVSRFLTLFLVRRRRLASANEILFYYYIRRE